MIGIRPFIALCLLLTTSVASASIPELAPVPGPASVPCVHATLRAPGETARAIMIPEGCEDPAIDLVWRYGDDGVSLEGALDHRATSPIVFRPLVDKILDKRPHFVMAADVEIVRLHWLTRLTLALDAAARPDERPTAVAPLAKHARFDALDEIDVLVHAEWRVRFDPADCGRSEASFLLAVDGTQVAAVAPPEIALLSCVASHGPGPTGAPSHEPLARELALVAARVLELAPPSAPAALALHALVPALPDAPPLGLAQPAAPTFAGASLNAPSGSALASAGALDAGVRSREAKLLADANALTPAGDAAVGANTSLAVAPLDRAPVASAIEAEPSVSTDRASAQDVPPFNVLAPENEALSRGEPGTPLAPRTGPLTGPEAAPRPGPALLADAPARPPPAPNARLAVAGFGAIALALYALYQRILRPKALDHEGRRALYDALASREAPETAGALGAAVGMARKTAEYHLVYLERLGIVRAHVDPDGPRRYALPIVRPAAESPTVDERLLADIRANPGACAPETAARLGITRVRADRRLKALVLDGAMDARVVEGARRYYAM